MYGWKRLEENESTKVSSKQAMSYPNTKVTKLVSRSLETIPSTLNERRGNLPGLFNHCCQRERERERERERDVERERERCRERDNEWMNE